MYNRPLFEVRPRLNSKTRENKLRVFDSPPGCVLGLYAEQRAAALPIEDQHCPAGAIRHSQTSIEALAVPSTLPPPGNGPPDFDPEENRAFPVPVL